MTTHTVQISGFDLLEKLGSGGMSTVWKARQISLDRVVAIKFLSPGMASDPADVRRFQAEAQCAAKLKHPGIVQVYDANFANGLYYIVMEYVGGYTVGDWLRRKGVLAERDSLVVAECVADALEYAWNKAGMIHCDIKPDNIMVDSDGTVKLSDMGLARTINVIRAGLISDEIMGTPSYISPEQAAGARDLDCRADIYSLGATLYHMLTGKLLFEGQPDGKIMELQGTDTVPDPLDLNPRISMSMAWMLEKMLCKSRDDRQKDWGAVRSDIGRVRRRLRPSGEPPREGASTVRRGERRIGRRPPAEPAGTLPRAPRRRLALLWILLVLVGAVTAAFWVRPDWLPFPLPWAAEPPAPPPEPEDGARLVFEEVARWAAANPEDYDEAIKRFRETATRTRGTVYAARAEDEIRKRLMARQEADRSILGELQDKAEALAADGQWDQAVAVFEQYDGFRAESTAKARATAADEWRKRRDKEQERARLDQSQQRVNAVLDRVAKDVVAQNLRAARGELAKAMVRPETAEGRDTLAALDAVLDGVMKMDRRVLASFEAQRGQETTLHLTSGKVCYRIVEVNGDRIVADQRVPEHHATARVTFGLKDLAPQEWLARIGGEDSPDVALYMGLIALRSGATARARECFSRTDPLIAARLTAQVDAIGREGKKASARPPAQAKDEEAEPAEEE